MAECLFEIFCEEIPARMQKRAGDDLVKLMDTGLKAAGLSPSGSRALTGPRRLTYVTNVETRSPDVSEERKGPRVGSPEQALAGFMRGAGLTDISQAETREDKKGEYYVAVLQSEGRDTADILAELIPSVMEDFPWPKSMKSGDTDFRWVRPLRGLTVLLGGKSLDGITIGGIGSDNIVHGHRQMGPGPFEVSDFADYQSKLTGEGHVMLDREARRARVLEQAKAVCAEAGLELVEDAGLLDEVTGLVEWPVAILGDMDASFLELPDEVIRLTLKSHQKIFTVRDADGKLTPNFVIMANLETPDGGATIKAGNAKVISARLSDAKFFQNQDRQKMLIDYYDQLDEVVFHKKLGSVRDKAARVAALAREIAPQVRADPEKTQLASKLGKCDLVTQTVIEATSLQGQVGRWMYEAEAGFDPDVAVAIEDHYKPQGPNDAVPANPVAVAVALADKIDTLVGFWAIDEKPTGSKDPFALRRAALGIVSTVIQNSLHLSILQFAHIAMIQAFGSIMGDNQDIADAMTLHADLDDRNKQSLWEFLESQLSPERVSIFKIFEAFDFGKYEEGDYHSKFGSEPWYKVDRMVMYSMNTRRDDFGDLIEVDEMTEAPGDRENRLKMVSATERVFRDKSVEVLGFLIDRLRIYLRDQGHRHDVIDAVIAQGGDDLFAISQRVEALDAFLSNSDEEDLVQGYKRAANILRAEQKKGKLDLANFDTLSGFTAKSAETLAIALSGIRPAIDAALDSGHYPAALSALANLRTPIDAFFTDVVVNSDDVDERARRLALLSAVVETFHYIADFSRLDG